MDLDSSDLDVSSDLKAVDLVWLESVSVRSEALAVHQNLESVFLILDFEIESGRLFEWNLSFTLLVAPFVGNQAVSDDSLLIESRIEVKSDVSVLLEQIDVESLALLLGHAVDDKCLTRGQALVGESALVWHRVVFATPVDVRDQDISIDGEVSDRRQRHAVLVLLQFLLIAEDLELAVVSTNSDVDIVTLLPRVRLSLFLAPFSLREGVADDLALVESDGDVQRHVMAGEVCLSAVQIDREADRVLSGLAFHDERLTGLKGLGQSRAVWNRIVGFEGHLFKSLCVVFSSGWLLVRI